MSSPFASKLGTNYCPRDDETAEIKTLLIEPTLRLQHLDGEITDLHKAIDKLTTQRAGLSAYVDAHKALISPARRLPLDIIQEIFVTCLPTDRNCAMSAVEAPILLGRICSAWRAISLLTPRLWAKLHIVEPLPHSPSAVAFFEKSLVQRIEAIKLWLGRSGQCPLSISINATGYDSPASLNQILQALLPFASCWEHLNFTIPFPALATVSHLTEADVPMLHSVTISEHTLGQVDWSSLGFLRGPKVHSFRLSANAFRLAELPLRWESLTDARID
ncbi:hypothetical protein B0H17DRAFT_1022522, partial [Mycena rosella]